MAAWTLNVVSCFCVEQSWVTGTGKRRFLLAIKSYFFKHGSVVTLVFFCCCYHYFNIMLVGAVIVLTIPDSDVLYCGIA